ncbi:MAG: alpha/beta fold hydrolase, partial [Gammaproteobacteria bacterium]
MAASLLLVPGMGCDSSMWQAQLAYFGADAQIADITRSGTIQALAADVLRDAPERFALAGLSMGGIVAFEIWRQASDRVSGMALLDTSYGAEGPERQLERDQQIERVRLQGISALKDLLISKLVPRYLVPGDTFALSE